MKLVKMGEPRCLTYSVAMLLDESPAALLGELGHRNLEVHIQEIQSICLRRGCVLVPFEFDPVGYDMRTGTEVTVGFDQSIIFDLLETQDAILCGRASYNKLQHAVAWCCKEHKIYDPNGLIYPITDFDIDEIWIRFFIKI